MKKLRWAICMQKVWWKKRTKQKNKDTKLKIWKEKKKRTELIRIWITINEHWMDGEIGNNHRCKATHKHIKTKKGW